jgi:hypothetical protein
LNGIQPLNENGVSITATRRGGNAVFLLGTGRTVKSISMIHSRLTRRESSKMPRKDPARAVLFEISYKPSRKSPWKSGFVRFFIQNPACAPPDEPVLYDFSYKTPKKAAPKGDFV